jgi:hypothetical protein
MIIQQFIDNDRLTDECWNSEMREVEYERYKDPLAPPVADGSSSYFYGLPGLPPDPDKKYDRGPLFA